MIKPSQRRQRKAQPKHLQLHRTIARGRSRSARLLVGSAAALAAAVVLWLFGAPFQWHVVAVLSAFLIGFIIPARGALHWALGWIAERAGLSYQTALELSSSDDSPDPYGFSTAVTEKAVLDTRQLEPPRLQAWWLPLAALALGLSLLPAPFGSGSRFAGLTLPGTSPARTTTAERSSTPDTPVAQQEQAQTTPPEVTPETLSTDADAPPVLEEFDEASGEAPEDTLTNNVGDEQALSRFLDNLSEREPPSEQTNPFSQVPPENNPNTSGERREGEPNTQAASDREQQSDGEPQQGSGEQSGENGDAQSQISQEDGTQGAQEETPSAEAPSEGQQQGEQSSQSSSDGSPTESDQPGAESEDPGSLDEGGNDSAGQGATLPGQTPSTDLSNEDQGEPDFLEGELGNGPNNLAGTIRLPGSAEGQTPGGTATGSYQGSEEQAITEGRIPVEYQEIVRNYFR